MTDKHLDKIKQLIDTIEQPEKEKDTALNNESHNYFLAYYNFITQAANARDSIKWAYEQLTLPEPLIMVDNVPIKISEYQGLIKSHEQELEHLQISIVKIREENARLREAAEKYEKLEPFLKALARCTDDNGVTTLNERDWLYIKEIKAIIEGTEDD